MQTDENDRDWDQLFALWKREVGAHVIEVAKQQTSKYPKNSARWLLLGESLSQLSRFDEAHAALETAEQLVPPSHRHIVWFKFGHLFARKGDHREASKWYTRTVDAEPDNATYLILFGSYLVERGEFDAAKDCQRRAIEAGNGATEEAHLNIGLVLRAEGRYEEALVETSRALELDPSYEDAKMLAQDLRAAIKARDARPPRPQASEPG